MLSAFLKKLLFARQFFIIDGKIEVLGEKQVMLPARLFSRLSLLDKKGSEKIIRSVFMEEAKSYAKKLGTGEEGILKNISDIFETFGIGRLEIIDLDNKNKKAVVRVSGFPEQVEGFIVSAAVSGVFSFLFEKEVYAKSSAKAKKDYLELIVK